MITKIILISSLLLPLSQARAGWQTEITEVKISQEDCMSKGLHKGEEAYQSANGDLKAVIVTLGGTQVGRSSYDPGNGICTYVYFIEDKI